MKKLILAFAAVFILIASSVFSGEIPKPIRGVWLTEAASDALDSKKGIDDAVDLCEKTGINAIYVAMWDSSMTNYPSQIMKNFTGVEINPRFAGRDPLQELIEAAHKKNIAVIPWFEFGFSSTYNDPSGGIIIQKKPEWKAIDKDGNLVSKNNFQWMNGFDPQVQDFMMSLIMEVVNKYDIEGVQGDDRLPAMPSMAGYDKYTSSLYRAKYNTEPPQDIYNAQWVDFRADLMNKFMERMHNDIEKFNKDNNKNILLAMSPSIFPWCKEEYLQDWPTWLQNNWVDYVFPQVYRYSLEAYTKTLDENALNYVPKDDFYKFYPGILIKLADWEIDQQFLEGIFKVNRERGINGEVFFYYEALKNPTIQKVIEKEYKN